MVRAPIVVVAIGMASAALAQTPMQQNGEGIPPGLSQKQAFVQGLVEDQSAANRILASQQPEAKRLLELARDSYAKALAALEGKDFNQAESRLDEAISEIGKARRLVPDTGALLTQQRADYEKTLDSVESLEKSYLSYSRRVKLQSSGTGSESGERLSDVINKMLDPAKSYAKAGRWNNALKEAEKAEQELKYQMGRVLGLMAVEYVKSFNSPAEEYAFAIERNRSLLELIPVVVSELHPSEDVESTIENLKEQNVAVMDLAEEYAKLKDYSKALIYAHSGIGYLEVALTSAGLIMPPEGGTR